MSAIPPDAASICFLSPIHTSPSSGCLGNMLKAVRTALRLVTNAEGWFRIIRFLVTFGGAI